jgi:hypothetical protein
MQHSPDPVDPAHGLEVLTQSDQAVITGRKAPEHDLDPGRRTLRPDGPGGSSVRYSISKAMSKVVVFQGRAEALPPMLHL